MKVLQDKYPLGSIKSQKTAGRYVDGILYENLSILAKAIVRDMTFLAFIFSSTLEVGTGKSVLASQIGEIWTALINELHKLDNKFDINNCVFKPADLIEKSFQVPKYSIIILDEWEDAHYWSQLGTTLRQFFRKCRQLNLFILCIIPNFFQLPIGYAISRSVFAIDVRFERDFERGFFYFYNFDRKKNLYIKGKKQYNYQVAKPNFYGRFADGYAYDDKKYKAKKLEDTMEMGDKIEVHNKYIIQRNILYELLKEKGVSQQQVADYMTNKGVNTTRQAISKVIANSNPRKYNNIP